MEKANVIKALTLCADGNCSGCPYYGIGNCDSEMCDDAVALLNASETPKEKPKYTHIEVYTKKGNLLKFFENNPKIHCTSTEEYNRMLAYYAKEREIQLIALFRYEKGKTFCKINCPENPMPTNKEFEAVSTTAVCRFLNEHGWTWKQDFYPRMFM
jgi:hypothetical protein